MSDFVYCGGTFDLFHLGHVEFFRRAAKYGPLVVSLNTDEFAAQYKRAPIMSLRERFAVIRACRHVTAVTVNTGGRDSRPSILRWEPRYIAHGNDWQGEALMKQLGLDQRFLDMHEIGMLYVSYTQSVSTSEIIARCKKEQP